MEAKIIKRSVVPNRFEIYENDVGSTFLFRIEKINDGVDVESLNGYLQTVCESGRTDKIALEKTVGETEVYFTLEVANNLTRDSGLTSAQITFENSQKTVVYSTEIFYIEVKETIDGLESYESVMPSVIESLQEEIEQKLEECVEIKNQAEQVKSQVESAKEEVLTLKQEVDRKHQDVSNSAVLSVNGKTGNAVLTCDDVGAMPNTTEIPTKLPNPNALIINGQRYDGSMDLSIDTSGEVEYVNILGDSITLKANKTTHVNTTGKTKRLIINRGNFGKSSTEKCVVYLKYTNDFMLHYKNDFYFYGDGTADGDFLCEEGFYKFEFVCGPSDEKVSVGCKKYEKVTNDYENVGSFPIRIKGKAGITYKYGMLGNLEYDKNYIRDYKESCDGDIDFFKGVGTITNDKLLVGLNTIKVLSETSNLIDISNFEGDSGCGVNITVDKKTGKLTFNGTVNDSGTIRIKFSNEIIENREYVFKMFNFGGTCVSSSTTSVFDAILQANYLQAARLEVFSNGTTKGTNDDVCVFSYHMGIDAISIHFPKTSIGTAFNNYTVGFMVGFKGYMNEFTTHKSSVSEILIENPLLSYNGKCDELDMENFRIIRRVQRCYIYDETFVIEAENGDFRYAGDSYEGLSFEDRAIDTSFERPVLLSGLKDELYETGLVVDEDGITFKKEVFPEFRKLNYSYFPYEIIYCLKNEKYENVKFKTPIKYFDELTHITIYSPAQPSASFFKTVVK